MSVRFFSASDFGGDIRLLTGSEAAEIANNLLADCGKTVYADGSSNEQYGMQFSSWRNHKCTTAKYKDTHRALLICIEKVEKNK